MAIRRLFSRRSFLYVVGGTSLATGGAFWYLNSGPAYPQSTTQTRRPPPPWTPPSRDDMLKALRASGQAKRLRGGDKDTGEEEFDLLVIGGGATGAGVALDAASRGLKVALVERDDFSAGTSSKSTKLVHGGVRYLQKAIMELDYSQYALVREALHERRTFLHTAPYLSNMLPIMLPVYKYWQIPYYWAGCKMYDMLAGKENMESSYLMSRGKALEAFPMLKSEGLVGAVVYYDGQHNDSRMNIALVLTAVKHGAVVANYCEVTSLLKSPASKLTGAMVRDNLTGKSFAVRAKGVINATGPFTDALLTLDNPGHKPIVQPSSGTHITLPGYYSPRTMGLLDPATSDGRVIFFLPWQGNTIAGTTDSPSTVMREPRAPEEDIRWVLEEVRRYLSPDIMVRRGDVLSAWSGLRPLVRNPDAEEEGGKTAGLVRSHVVHVSQSGLLTIAGGKWTTYRKMAEETVDRAVEVFGLEHKVKSGCVTESLRLVGSDGWSRTMFIGLVQTYGLETEVARHLSDNYGDRAWTVCSLAEPTGEMWPLYGKRLVPQYPFIEGEVRYAVRHEYARTAIDVLARRTRLSFLNARAALDALPRVIDIMAAELSWTLKQRREQLRTSIAFLVETMGLAGDAQALTRELESELGLRGGWGWSMVKNLASVRSSPPARFSRKVYGRARFEPGELAALRGVFDSRAKGAEHLEKVKNAEVMDIVKALPGYTEITPKDYAYVLEEAGLKDVEEFGFEEFIEICGNLKDVAATPATTLLKQRRQTIPVEKSGGGV